MSLHRFFLTAPLPPSGEVAELALSDADRHHLSRVLRLRPGDRVVAVGDDAREAEATLVEVREGAVRANVSEPVDRPLRPRVALAAAVSRRERMEFAVQKATELGVSEILPVMTARCVVRLDARQAAARGERWRRIALEAAKQSQRPDVPIVRDPLTIAGLVEQCARFDVVLVPWEEAAADTPGVGDALRRAGATSGTSVLVVIGPEGGLEEAEVEAVRSAGGVVVTLGDTILRTETASVVAVALATYELGGLGGHGR